MIIEYDIIIVGASFAGLACAKEAAGHGLRVLVLERRKALDQHIHTTGIFVEKAAGEYPLPPHLIKTVSSVRLYAPSLRYVDIENPSYRFFTTDTPALMTHMAAEAGVEIRLDTAFSSYEISGESIIIPALGLRSKFLVGADGARSAVAKAAGLSQNTTMLKGAEYEYEGLEGLGDRLHVFLDSRLAPGYIAWAFQGAKIAQVGLACKAPVAPDMEAFIQKIAPLFDFSAARLAGKRGGWIPVGGTLAHTVKDNVMLVGDAAGMVSPLTAGGIYTALHHGKRLAEGISEYLRGGKHPAVSVVPHYPAFRGKKILRRMIDLNPPNWTYEMLVRSIVFKNLAAKVFYK